MTKQDTSKKRDLRQAFKNSRNLQDFAERHNLSAQNALKLLRYEDIQVRRGDEFWVALQDGKTIADIAKECDVTGSNVRGCLKAAGYARVYKQKKPKRTYERGTGYRMSRRLKEAYHYIMYRPEEGAERFIKALTAIEAAPESFVLENIGVDEDRVYVSMERLGAKTIGQIKRVVARVEETQGITLWGASPVVRQVLERIIEEDGLERFAKPEGWTPRPLTAAQGGDRNPVTKLDAQKLTVTLPRYLHQKIAHYAMPKGHAHDPNVLDMARFVRMAIDHVAQDDAYDEMPDYAPLKVPSPRPFVTVQSIGISILTEQFPILERIRTSIYATSLSDAVAAAVAYETGEPTHTGTHSKEPEWTYMEALSRQTTRILDGAAEACGVAPDAMLDALEAKGWAQRTNAENADPERWIRYVIDNDTTIRAAAKEFEVSESLMRQHVKAWAVENGIEISFDKRFNDQRPKIKAVLDGLERSG